MTARQQIRVGRLGRERSPIDAQPAPTVGEMLQAARDKKGVDLYRAERDTKIRARHLAALESGDYAELPGSVYTKGFLRNYALYLGLDPEELLSRWRDEQDYGRRGEPVAVTHPPQPITEPRRGFTFTPGLVIAAVLSVVVLAFAGYVGLQLVRFAQVPGITLQGDRIIRLPEDARTLLLRGGAGPQVDINISGPDGRIIQTSTADESGAWVTELGVSKGRNDFTLVARDPETDRESAPLEVIATVPVPATPAPSLTPAPVVTPAPSLAPGATPTPVPTPAPIITPGPGATTAPLATAGTVGVPSQLAVTAPAEGATIENEQLQVSGTSDAGSVTVDLAWAGSGTRPRAPAAETLKVREGSFRGTIPVPGGRWTVTITAVGDGPPTIATRTVDVRYTGMVLTVEARSGSAWIKVWVDGELADEGHTFRKGETATFTAKRSAVVSSGNAGATHVVINGEAYGALGDDGQVATMEFVKGREPRPLTLR